MKEEKGSPKTGDFSRQASRDTRRTPSNLLRQALTCRDKQSLPQACPFSSFPQHAHTCCGKRAHSTTSHVVLCMWAKAFIDNIYIYIYIYIYCVLGVSRM